MEENTEIEIEVEEAWDRVIENAKRREFLGKYMPRCPKCDDVQVQLTSYLDVAAQWKCRICKHRFEYEPKRG